MYVFTYLSNCKNLFEWFYIRKPNNNADSLVVGDSYTTHRYQSSLESVMHVYYSFGLDMDVPYQRGYVWTEEDQVNLIHSIFNNKRILFSNKN